MRKFCQAASDGFFGKIPGLPNRRAGMAELEQALKLVAADNDAPLSVALIDLNFLKYINDTFSHAEGARALRLAADILREGSDGNASGFRLSGDEFVMLFPGEGRHAAIQRLEGTRAKLGRRWQAEGLPSAVDFSFGVTEVSPGTTASASEVKG